MIKHITIVSLIALFLIVGTYTFYKPVFSAPKIDCLASYNKLINEAKVVYKKDLQQLSNAKYKYAQATMRKAVADKIDAYINKKMPASCKSSSRIGWKTGMQIVFMFLGL